MFDAESETLLNTKYLQASEVLNRSLVDFCSAEFFNYVSIRDVRM